MGLETVLIGEVLRAHGVRGELKVYPLTHNPKRFKKLPRVILQRGSDVVRLTIRRVEVQPDFVFLSLEGIDTREQAEKYQGYEVRVERTEVLPLGPDTYYYFELEGMQVFEGNVFLGEITQIIETGANDVYVISGPKGEFCIPALKSVVREVNVPGKRMQVELPPGLLDD